MENHSGVQPTVGPGQGVSPGQVPEAPSAREAAEQLRDYEAVRDRSEERRPPRSLLLLEMWTAVMMTAYLATALTMVGRYGSPYHLLLAFGVMAVLSAGARERFPVRKRPGLRGTAGQWLAVLAFLVLGVLRLRDVLYPWWVDALLLLAVLAGLAARPARQWLLPSGRAESTEPVPLTTPVRFNTVVVAALLGFLMATAAWQYGWLIAIAFPLLAVIELVRSNSRWSLRRTGYEWTSVHWLVFGVGTLLLFALVLLSLSDQALVPALGIGIGSAFALVMSATGLLPRRGGRAVR